MSPFEAFSREFFMALGATVSEQDGRLEVALVEPLLSHYGRERLLLTFKPHDAQGELVAYGSRAFEEMQRFLATRGRFTACRLAASGAVPEAPSLTNGTALALGAEPSDRRYYMVHHHLTFLSDERTERLMGVALDEEARPAPEAGEWLENADGGEPLGQELAVPPHVLVAAEDMALAEAEQLAGPIEEAVLERLRKVASRIVGYYEEQIEETTLKRRRGLSEDEALEALLGERRFLREEMGRKLDEEVSRHQLRIQVRRVSQATLVVPGVTRRVLLESRHARRQLAYWENRHTGEAHLPACERCGSATRHYGLCAEHHLVCPACLGGCGSCGEDRCSAELDACHQCATGMCERCREACAGGHAVCRTHLAGCSCCGQAFCEECRVVCPDCPPERGLASAHGTPCAQCDRPVCPEHQRGCGLCGVALCGAHAVACPGCGDRVCERHLARCPHCELPYCARCRDEDPYEDRRMGACRACSIVGEGPEAPGHWLAEVQDAQRYQRWTGIENERYRYLLGHGLLGDTLVVTELSGGVVKVKDIGFWQKLFRYF